MQQTNKTTYCFLKTRLFWSSPASYWIAPVSWAWVSIRAFTLAKFASGHTNNTWSGGDSLPGVRYTPDGYNHFGTLVIPWITNLSSNWSFLLFSWERCAPMESYCIDHSNLAGHWQTLIWMLLWIFHLFRVVNEKVKPQLLKAFTQSQSWTFIFHVAQWRQHEGQKNQDWFILYP